MWNSGIIIETSINYTGWPPKQVASNTQYVICTCISPCPCHMYMYMSLSYVSVWQSLNQSIIAANTLHVGLCCLCPNSNNSLLAYPGVQVGHVSMLDLADLQKPVADFATHEAPLSCIALNLQGTRLATASEKVQYYIIVISYPMGWYKIAVFGIISYIRIHTCKRQLVQRYTVYCLYIHVYIQCSASVTSSGDQKLIFFYNY